MTTLILGSAGESLGGSLFGIPGAIAGRLAGTLAGSEIDRRLFAPSERSTPQNGLEGLPLLGSTEGAAIPRIFGHARVGGQVIWTSPYSVQRGQPGRGKGTNIGGSSPPSEDSYRLSLAIGLAEGVVHSVGRIWANGQLLNSSNISFRFYQGDETQTPDPAIEAALGADNSPAFRGLAYIVFEDLDLAPFGNRIPQFSFELSRVLSPITGKIRAVNMIPGASEFAYHPTPHRRDAGFSRTASENVHNAQGISDWSASLNQLGEQCPSCRYVSLVVSWFGDDLRVGHCKIRPAVEGRNRLTVPTMWEVSGISRHHARVVSQKDGRPAFGGTPSDSSVLAALRDLKQRGYKILFYPFLLMDIPPGNGLPNPEGGSEQPAYPWRGHINCLPAPGQHGSPDGSAAIAAQVGQFFGNANADDFAAGNDRVVYTGTGADATGLRRMILHYAHLCKLAGGVDAFLVGSELRGITRLREGAGDFVAAKELSQLAAEVEKILPHAELSYAADWSEYGHYVPPDKPAARLFPLDDLWADAAIDFVGIDYYLPLADWRDSEDHLDKRAGTESTYDLDYLRNNIRGGEYYDWYYQSDAARASQTRTAITGSDAQAWRWRAKDIAGWWRHAHQQTIIADDGTVTQRNSAWQAGSKPVWLTEIGCAAVDKGANQPNVFFDPKSSDSARPYFSSGQRDDLMQARYLDALLTGFNENHPDFLEDANPTAPDNPSQRMLSPDHLFVWAWDARPYPAFPERDDIWGDAANWATGHWINGRLTAADLASSLADMLRYAGLKDISTEGLASFLRGFVISEVTPTRDALDALMRLFFFDAVQSGDTLRFFPRRQLAPPIVLDENECAISNDNGNSNDGGWHFTRKQQGDLPASVKLIYLNHEAAYQQAVAQARLPSGGNAPTALVRLPLVANADEAESAAGRWLRESRIAGESAVLTLPPSRMALEPGDLIQFKQKLLRITRAQDGAMRQIEAVCCDPELYGASLPAAARAAVKQRVSLYGAPELFLLDVPSLRGGNPYRLYAAAISQPWPGALALYRSYSADSGFSALASIRQRAVMGQTHSPLPPHPPARWDETSHVDVLLAQGELASRNERDVLNGANLAAIRQPASQTNPNPRAEWELFQFRNAELVGENLYRLSGLLRGLAGSDQQAAIAKATGADFVLLEEGVHQFDLAAIDKGQTFFYRIGPPDSPHGSHHYAALDHRFHALALRPFAPVHLAAKKEQDGSVLFEWIRRTRIGGDSWEAGDVPLGEEQESYALEVLRGGSVVRTLTSAVPHCSYASNDILADFGTAVSQFHVRLYQTNALFGRSPPKEALLNV